MNIEVLRTEDARFDPLPDWPYRPKYVDHIPGYEGLRMHFVDEGAADAPVFLCLHGEPTWSYLYRKMIPAFLEADVRVVAPDFFGFGRSDKPVDDSVYTWDFHRDALLGLIERLDLEDVTLVVQDWGGLLGLTVPVDMPERISGLLVMNTVFAVGAEPTPGFVEWRDYVANTPDLAVGRLMQRSCPQLSDAEAAAYDAPFPSAGHKAGVRRFPALVPTDPDMDGVEVSKRAVEWWSNEFEGRSFMAIGETDPVLASAMPAVHKRIKGCPPPLRLPEAGHFVQEWGEEVARAALAEWGM
ncbi:MAG TPA: haloalkane dehalogenase [Acidimicrobiia bacterium]|nr:haloalkane dehalogenase [Acidimicrobiia bacterium]